MFTFRRSELALLMTLGCTGLESASDSFPAGGAAGAAGAGPSAGAGATSCVDPLGFNGLGCRTCAGTDIVTLESACTVATCTRFDEEARLPALGPEGRLPALPAAVDASGGTAAGGAASAGGAANAAACSELEAKGSVVYVTGSTAAKPYLQQIARQLAEQSVYLVYTSTGSCVGVDAIVNATPMTTGPAPASAPAATYWSDAASTGASCLLPEAGVLADIGISDVFAQSCSGFELTNPDSMQVRDAHGPIQVMAFAVPANSAYAEISARAAYLVFGFGRDGRVLAGDGGSEIWNDEQYILQRSATSGTQAMIAAAIGVPAKSFRGKSHKTSDDVATDLFAAGATQATASKAIGILSADYIDTQSLRAQIRMLAYQDTHQPCAVYPDSSAGARDKQNVRDGHYPIWGPLHLLYKVDGSGAPANVATRQQILDIIAYLTGSKALPNGVRLIDVYAQTGVVPECAMRVTRTNDGGNIVPFTPVNPCSCLYDAVATGFTACAKCSVQGDCAAGETCSLGYCEH